MKRNPSNFVPESFDANHFLESYGRVFLWRDAWILSPLINDKPRSAHGFTTNEVSYKARTESFQSTSNGVFVLTSYWSIHHKLKEKGAAHRSSKTSNDFVLSPTAGSSISLPSPCRLGMIGFVLYPEGLSKMLTTMERGECSGKRLQSRSQG